MLQNGVIPLNHLDLVRIKWKKMYFFLIQSIMIMFSRHFTYFLIDGFIIDILRTGRVLIWRNSPMYYPPYFLNL